MWVECVDLEFDRGQVVQGAVAPGHVVEVRDVVGHADVELQGRANPRGEATEQRKWKPNALFASGRSST